MTLPAIPDPRPQLPFGIVWAMGSWVDGDSSDGGRNPDVHPLAGVAVRFELSHRTLVSQFEGHREIHLKRAVDAAFDARGVLQRLPDSGDPGQTPAGELGVALLPTNSPSIMYVGGGDVRWTVSPIGASGFPRLSFPLSEGEVLDLADVIAAGASAGDGQAAQYASLLTAAADLQALMQAGATSIDRIEQTGTNTVDFVLTDGSRWPVTIPGSPGKSAYQTAVDLGFEGSESDWLASLRGADADAPEVVWVGAQVSVGGQLSPDLTGPDGDPGPPNSLAVGTVTPGTVAGAEITGTAPAQTLNLTLPKGDKGDPGPSGGPVPPGGEPGQTLTPVLGGGVEWVESSSAFELRGTGMPNGIVTADPGTYYTDTAGTNGAWRWLKTSGTGNTGWTVIHGDTGWRNVTPAWVSAGGIYMKREGIYLSLVGRQFTNTSTGTLTLGPSNNFAGFRPPKLLSDTSGAAIVSDTGASIGKVTFWDGTVQIKLQTTGTDRGFTLVQPGVIEPWPTALPGTLA